MLLGVTFFEERVKALHLCLGDACFFQQSHELVFCDVFHDVFLFAALSGGTHILHCEAVDG